MADPAQEQFAIAKTGLECEAFMNSTPGRYLLGVADQEAQEALEALGTVDPKDTDAIQKEQNKLWRARSFRQWLEEAVASGQQAEYVLQHYDQE